MITNAKNEVEEWLKSVQKGEGSLVDWFLFLGIVAMVTYLWMQAIKRMVD